MKSETSDSGFQQSDTKPMVSDPESSAEEPVPEVRRPVDLSEGWTRNDGLFAVAYVLFLALPNAFAHSKSTAQTPTVFSGILVLVFAAALHGLFIATMLLRRWLRLRTDGMPGRSCPADDTRTPARPVSFGAACWIAFFTGVGAFVAFSFLTQCQETLFSKLGIHTEMQNSVLSLLSPETPVSLKAAIAAFALLVAPFCEEFIYRGVLFCGALSCGGGAFSVVLLSLFFAAVHLNLLALIPLFLLSLLLCAFVRRFGSLWPAVVLHAAFNLCNLVATFFLAS